MMDGLVTKKRRDWKERIERSGLKEKIGLFVLWWKEQNLNAWGQKSLTSHLGICRNKIDQQGDVKWQNGKCRRKSEKQNNNIVIVINNGSFTNWVDCGSRNQANGSRPLINNDTERKKNGDAVVTGGTGREKQKRWDKCFLWIREKWLMKLLGGRA